jgi:hypothetical protein
MEYQMPLAGAAIEQKIRWGLPKPRHNSKGRTKMRTMTLNTNSLEAEGFRELTSNELTAAQGGSGAVSHQEMSAQKLTDKASVNLY